MKQVLVAACVGIVGGWMGFGWVLAEAPVDMVASRGHMVATQSLHSHDDAVRLGMAGEPNLRG